MGRRLGQHFLRNKEVAKKITDALELSQGDAVLEVGAGRGALTRELIASLASFPPEADPPLAEASGASKTSKGRVVAIEKDGRLAESLRTKIKDPEVPFEIIEGDMLKVLPELAKSYKALPAGRQVKAIKPCLPAGRYKLVGNIPYYLTGRLFRIIGELERKPKTVVLMIQKEVAERVSASPPKMNLLAASVQFWADTEVLFSVSQKEFVPQPKVESAVIKLKIKKRELTEKQIKNYYSLVKILFKQPRKTILNNLSAGLEKPKKELAVLKKRKNENSEQNLDWHSVQVCLKKDA